MRNGSLWCAMLALHCVLTAFLCSCWSCCAAAAPGARCCCVLHFKHFCTAVAFWPRPVQPLASTIQPAMRKAGSLTLQALRRYWLPLLASRAAGGSTPWPTRTPRMAQWPTCAARRRSAGRRRRACAAPASCATSASRWGCCGGGGSLLGLCVSASDAPASCATSASGWCMASYPSSSCVCMCVLVTGHWRRRSHVLPSSFFAGRRVPAGAAGGPEAGGGGSGGGAAGACGCQAGARGADRCQAAAAGGCSASLLSWVDATACGQLSTAKRRQQVGAQRGRFSEGAGDCHHAVRRRAPTSHPVLMFQASTPNCLHLSPCHRVRSGSAQLRKPSTMKCTPSSRWRLTQ